MKLAIASDFHMEFRRFNPRLMDCESDVDFIILAGDIDVGVNAISVCGQYAEAYQTRVLFVPGNHEYYHGDIDTTNKEMFAVARDTRGVTMLDYGMTLEADDVTFIGATMWTDFWLDPVTKFNAGRWMNDYRMISRGQRTLIPDDTELRNASDVQTIFEEIDVARTLGRKPVVITHHGCTTQSIADEFKGDDLNGAFVNRLDNRIAYDGPDLWIHGHVHSVHDYVVGDTRVVVNAVGYPNERRKSTGLAQAFKYIEV